MEVGRGRFWVVGMYLYCFFFQFLQFEVNSYTLSR